LRDFTIAPTIVSSKERVKDAATGTTMIVNHPIVFVSRRRYGARSVNPTWIEGMKKEGYAGAGAMREFVEYLWGWNATVPEPLTPRCGRKPATSTSRTSTTSA
jgi:hypothetical protein